MTIPRTPDGRIMPLGQVRIERSIDFLDGTIPAPFEAYYTDNAGASATGTTTIDTGTPYPRATLMSPAVANNKALLRLKYDLDATKLKAVWLRVQGLRWSIEGGGDFSIRLATPASSGISLYHAVNGGQAQPAVIRLDKATSTDLDTPFRFYGPDAAYSPALVPRDITLLWQISRGRAYILEENLEVFEVDVSAATVGMIRPQIVANTRNTTARGMTVERVTIGYEHN